MGVVKFILKSQNNAEKQRLSLIAKTVAMVTVAISVAVMVVAVAIVEGYKEQLNDNISSVFGDYKLVGRNAEARWQSAPIVIDSQQINEIKAIKEIEQLMPIVQSNAVIRVGAQMTGVAAQGCEIEQLLKSKTAKFFSAIQTTDQAQNDIFISVGLAEKLDLVVGDDISLIFFKESPILVQLQLAGVYTTHLAEIDDAVVWMHIDKLRELVEYQKNEADFYQIISKKNKNNLKLEEELDYFTSQTMALESSQETYQYIYDWIYMLDNNITMLIIIMAIVMGINIISVVLIVILENTASVGILKSLGMKNKNLILVYGIKTSYVTAKGILIGTATGVMFCLIQKHFRLIELDPYSYLVDAVPIAISPAQVAIVAVVAFAVSMIFTILPTLIIAKIDPYKTLKFE